jgi:hypothetical protein
VASILQSFHILFESNVDKVRVGEELLNKTSKDLEGQLNRTGEAATRSGHAMVEANAEAAGSFRAVEESIDRMKENALEAFKDIATSFIGIFAVDSVVDKISETTEMVEHLGQVSKELNINVSDLDAWGRAVKLSGGSAESFEASLRGLNGRLALMGASAAGGKVNGANRVAAYFKELGIQGVITHGQIMPLPELLMKLSASFQGMDKQKSAGIGMKLGLDPATILLLQSGQKAVQDMIDKQKELGVVTQKDVEIASEFEDQWKDTKQVFTEGAIGIGDVVLPIITEVLKGIEDFYLYLQNHKAVITGFFIGVAGAVTAFYAPAMLEAATATIAATWPFIAIAAAAAAFALVYEDLVDYLAGKNSVIGELAKRWPIIGTVIHGVADEVTNLWATAKQVFGEMVTIFENPKKSIADLQTWLEKLGQTILSAIESPFKVAYAAVNQFISKLLDFPNVLGAAFAAIKFVMATVMQGITFAISALTDDAKQTVAFFDSIIDAIGRVIKAINNMLGLADKAAAVVNALNPFRTETPKQIAQDTAQTASLPAARTQTTLAKAAEAPAQVDDAGFAIIGTGYIPPGTPADMPGHPGRPIITPIQAPERPPSPSTVPTLAPAQTGLQEARQGAAALVLSPEASKGAAQANAAPVTNNTTVNAPITINPPAGADANAIGKAAADHLTTQIQATHKNLQSGVAG